MKKLIVLLAALFATSSFAANPVVIMKTSLGDITIELNQTLAPVTVKNFLSYVDEKFYDNTIFHRVIDNFMIQGGGFDEDMGQKKTHAPIKNEAANGLSNTVGSIAMARTSVVDSATAQFFINVNDNTFLDHRSNAPQEFGYAVFGRVTSGMSVVNAIKKQATGDKMGHQNVPLKSIVIHSVRRVPTAPTK